MIDIQKQIEYWRDQAVSDIETAEILIEKKKLLHGLFFCHLVIEKILKAHYVKTKKDVPPKTHQLNYLAKNSDLVFSPDQINFLGILMKYQLEGRYPENSISSPSVKIADKYLSQTKELLEWLKNQL
ncbi:MAG: HEPN domain-containing protein [Bacteroidetes bacterium]|nr:HEPN domain-containing protein [Bacteroidota bacterium]MBU2585412.1 HEPN domain-containing protein [Bacteroidota bacterium]